MVLNVQSEDFISPRQLEWSEIEKENGSSFLHWFLHIRTGPLITIQASEGPSLVLNQEGFDPRKGGSSYI